MSMSSPSLAPAAVVAQDLRCIRDGREVLRGADLTIAPGESVAVLGRDDDAGAPRVLCQVLAGLAMPTTGWVHWGGHDLVRLSDSARSALRRRDVGVVLDDAVLPELPVSENIALPLLLDGWSHREAAGRAADLLDVVGLTGAGARRMSQLSERDRVLVAFGRGLVTAPQLVVVDDPTGALDPVDRAEVLDILLTRCTATGAALVLGTADERVADRCARRLEIVDGRVRRQGAVHYAGQALL